MKKLSIMLALLLVFALALSPLIPNDFVATAFDSGGVTTGPITVPFIMALGVGLASVRGDKNSADDSFGLVALCSVGPILTVLILGMFNDTSGIVAESTVISEYGSIGEAASAFVVALPHYFEEVAIALLPIIVFFVVFQIFALKLDKMFKEMLDPTYEKKLKPGDLDCYDEATVAGMKAFCEKKYAAFKAMYDVADKLGK